MTGTETENHDSQADADQNAFSRAADDPDIGLLAEFRDFLRTNKKWWLTPIILIILLMAGLILLGPAAPFIYPMF